MPTVGEGVKVGNGARGPAPGALLEGLGISGSGMVLPEPRFPPVRRNAPGTGETVCLCPESPGIGEKVLSERDGPDGCLPDVCERMPESRCRCRGF